MQKYSLIKSNSKVLSYLHCLVDNLWSSLSFSQDGIAKLIQNLDPPNKAHGHDNISMRMLKICSSIYKSLEIILKYWIETGVFPSEWKKFNQLQSGVAYLYPRKPSENLKVSWCFQGVKISNTGMQCVNIVSIHKKGDKETLKNYRPVSLLPICAKVLESYSLKIKVQVFYWK